MPKAKRCVRIFHPLNFPVPAVSVSAPFIFTTTQQLCKLFIPNPLFASSVESLMPCTRSTILLENAENDVSNCPENERFAEDCCVKTAEVDFFAGRNGGYEKPKTTSWQAYIIVSGCFDWSTCELSTNPCIHSQHSNLLIPCSTRHAIASTLMQCSTPTLFHTSSDSASVVFKTQVGILKTATAPQSGMNLPTLQGGNTTS